jgi:hypothetical protein
MIFVTPPQLEWVTQVSTLYLGVYLWLVRHQDGYALYTRNGGV